MKRISPEVRKAFKEIEHHYPAFCKYLAEWRQEELEKLPSGVAISLDVMRGRVQTLTELQKAISDCGKTP